MKVASAAARPVRLAHLGLGAFFRAHQAWYTDRAPDAEEWGIAAFSGRGPSRVLDDLAAAGGSYHLIERGDTADRVERVDSLAAVRAGTDTAAWTATLADPAVRALTLTVTEAGYRLGPDGAVDGHDEEVAADVETLRRSGADAVVHTAPGRVVAGLAARRRADGGPLAVVPCDNLAGNAAAARAAVVGLAGMVDDGLAGWVADSVGFVGTVVDRVTPATTPADVEVVAALAGAPDPAVVVTEPFAEWVIGPGLAGSPDWVAAGARLATELGPWEDRKLRLLNGAHCLLAYLGPLRGATTVDGAMADAAVRGWLEEWWDEASTTVDLPPATLAAYRTALEGRFGNPRIRHQLGQIAADGSRKLPIRVLPVLDRRRASGAVPAGAARILAGWICHLRGLGGPVTDVDADHLVPLAAGPLPDAAPRVLDALAPGLGDDVGLVAAVVELARELERIGRPPTTLEHP